jgi:hypothetical protein
MEWMLRPLLILVYIAFLPAMLLNRALGRDPLQLKDPGTSSYWLVRQSRGRAESYASESSDDEGFPTFREGASSGPRVGTAPSALSGLLRGLARLFSR